jgi:hypothetical protein
VIFAFLLAWSPLFFWAEFLRECAAKWSEIFRNLSGHNIHVLDIPIGTQVYIWMPDGQAVEKSPFSIKSLGSIAARIES